MARSCIPRTSRGHPWGLWPGIGKTGRKLAREPYTCVEKTEADSVRRWVGSEMLAVRSRLQTAPGFGTGWGESLGKARSEALSSCERHGNTNCRIRAAQCAKTETGRQLARSDRRRIQSALAAQGANPGPADGVFGPKTRAAIKEWQSSRGYSATGSLTDEQVRVLLAANSGTAQSRPTKKTPSVARSKKSDDLWGSIAFSQDPGGGYTWAMVWNSSGHEQAKQLAMEKCRGRGGENCQDVGWFKNQCAALAVGDGNGFAGGGGRTTAEAESTALSKCRTVDNNCRIVVSRCTDTATEASGGAKAPEKKEPVVATEPKCRFGHEIYSRKEREEKKKIASTFFKAEVLDLEAYLSFLNRDGMTFGKCWLEVSNIPGCQIFRGIDVGEWGPNTQNISPFRIPRPEKLEWSGECVNGVVEGKGTLTITLPGWTPLTNEPWTYKGGMRNERVRLVDKRSSLECVLEGRYVNGLRQGEWNQSCENCPPGHVGKFRYVDGQVIDCPGIGRYPPGSGTCFRPCH